MKFKRVSHAISPWLIVGLLSVSFQPRIFAVTMRPLVMQSVRVVQDDDALIVGGHHEAVAVWARTHTE